MKKIILFAICLLIILISCQNETKSEMLEDKNTKSESTLVNIKSSILNHDTSEIPEPVNENINNEKIIVDNKDKNTVVTEKKKELKQKKEKVIEKKYKNSIYKKMNCKEMILKYENILKEFKKTGNEELLLWKDSNDPIFKFCYEKNKIVFDSLERIENELGEKFGM